MRFAHTHRVVCQVDIAVVACELRSESAIQSVQSREASFQVEGRISRRIRARNEPDMARLDLLRLSSMEQPTEECTAG